MPLTRAATISVIQQRNWLGFVWIINKNAGFSVVSCPFRMYKARPAGYSYSCPFHRAAHTARDAWLVLHPFLLGLDPLFPYTIFLLYTFWAWASSLSYHSPVHLGFFPTTPPQLLPRIPQHVDHYPWPLPLGEVGFVSLARHVYSESGLTDMTPSGFTKLALIPFSYVNRPVLLFTPGDVSAHVLSKIQGVPGDFNLQFLDYIYEVEGLRWG